MGYTIVNENVFLFHKANAIFVLNIWTYLEHYSFIYSDIFFLVLTILFVLQSVKALLGKAMPVRVAPAAYCSLRQSSLL